MLQLEVQKCILCFFIMYDAFHEPAIDLFIGNTELI